MGSESLVVHFDVTQAGDVTGIADFLIKGAIYGRTVSGEVGFRLSRAKMTIPEITRPAEMSSACVG